MNKGILVVVSGFSGAGKGTLNMTITRCPFLSQPGLPEKGNKTDESIFFGAVKNLKNGSKRIGSSSTPSMWVITTARQRIMCKSN